MNENTNNDEQDNKKGNAASPTAVTIDLDALDSTKALGKKELIFYDECQHMVDNIRKKARSNIKKIKSKNSSVHNNVDADSQSTPNCFFIDGPRGSGKSTLMRAIRQELVHPDNAEADETTVKLYPLADIDPTELGKGENFFIYLLGKIYALLDREFEKSNNNDIAIRLIRDAMQSLREMSGGLQILMDSEGVLRNEETPEFFIENCLEKCADSSIMRTKLSSLTNTLAMIVKTDVFLVTIDDADLNFNKCEDLLEYIRKYMHSSRLIFLFAGDMQLYSQIVRGMQLHNFREKQLEHDTRREKSRGKLLDSIEDQYLLKLFPLDNRIQTSSLKAIVNWNRKINIHISKVNRDDPAEDLDLKHTLVTYLKIKTEEATIDTILDLPLRSILFLLRYLTKNPYKSNTPEAALFTWKGIQDVFQQALIDYNVNYAQIGTHDIRILQKTVLEYHAHAGLWYADLSMQANEGETKARQVALYLAGSVSRASMYLSAKIKYWCACFPLWQRVREEYIYTSYEKEAYEFLDLCLQLANERQRGTWANLACAAVAPNEADLHQFNLGTICILNNDCRQDNEIGQEERQGFKSWAKDMLNRKQFENDEEKWATAAINNSLCRIDRTDNSYYYISIYHLLMNIAEWLDFGNDLLSKQSETALTVETKESAGRIKRDISIRMEKETVACQTPSISSTYRHRRYYTTARNGRHSESISASTDELPVERITHTYKCYTSSKMIDEMYDWLMEYVSCSYASSASEFSQAWDAFQGACSKLAFDVYSDSGELISPLKASSILLNYMKAVEHAAGSFTPETGLSLKECIVSFPYWKALKSLLEHSSNFKTNFDKARIGEFVNFKLKEKCHQYKLRYEQLASQIKGLENNQTDTHSKYILAQTELDEAQKQMDEMQAKNKRIREEIIQNIENQQKIDSDCKVCYNQELHLEQEILNCKRGEEELVHRLSEIQQYIAHIEKALKGKSDDFPEYTIMMEYIQQHLQHKFKTRLDTAKREHQAAIDAIKMEIKQRQLEEQKNASEDEYKHAKESRRKYQLTLNDLRADISTKTVKKAEIERDRIQKERDLSRIKERIEEFSKLDLQVQLEFETAKFKYNIAKKYANETKDAANRAEIDLKKGKEMCKQAEEDYNNFKIYNPNN